MTVLSRSCRLVLQAKSGWLTFWMGKLLYGARTPLSWPWSAPLTDTLWKMEWALAAVARATRVNAFIVRVVVLRMKTTKWVVDLEQHWLIS